MSNFRCCIAVMPPSYSFIARSERARRSLAAALTGGSVAFSASGLARFGFLLLWLAALDFAAGPDFLVAAFRLGLRFTMTYGREA